MSNFKPGDRVTLKEGRTSNWNIEGVPYEGPKQDEIVTVVTTRQVNNAVGLSFKEYPSDNYYNSISFRKVVNHTTSVSAKDLLTKPQPERLDVKQPQIQTA